MFSTGVHISDMHVEHRAQDAVLVPFGAAGMGAGIFTSLTVEPGLYSDVLYFTRGFGCPMVSGLH